MKKIIKNIIDKILYDFSKLFFLISLPFKRAMRSDLSKFSFNYHSQNGEDGIIQEIIRRLGIQTGWVVEFGAWDGVYLSNTFRVLEKHPGFRAVFIEGEPARFKDLESLSKKILGRIIPLCAFVSPQGENSLDNLLSKTKIPNDFEILSIDVDSIDYQIWQGTEKYQPKIVIIEINSGIPNNIEQIHNKGKGLQGSSFLSTLKLGNKKGYTLLIHTGNMIFVRNDLLNKIVVNNTSLSDQIRLFK